MIKKLQKLVAEWRKDGGLLSEAANQLEAALAEHGNCGMDSENSSLDNVSYTGQKAAKMSDKSHITGETPETDAFHNNTMGHRGWRGWDCYHQAIEMCRKLERERENAIAGLKMGHEDYWQAMRGFERQRNSLKQQYNTLLGDFADLGESHAKMREALEKISNSLDYWKGISECDCYSSLPNGGCLKCDIDKWSEKANEALAGISKPSISNCKEKFTVEEIKEWLEGWFLVPYSDGKPTGSLPLEAILSLLECEQDGIVGWKERKEYYKLRQ